MKGERGTSRFSTSRFRLSSAKLSLALNCRDFSDNNGAIEVVLFVATLFTRRFRLSSAKFGSALNCRDFGDSNGGARGVGVVGESVGF